MDKVKKNYKYFIQYPGKAKEVEVNREVFNAVKTAVGVRNIEPNVKFVYEALGQKGHLRIADLPKHGDTSYHFKGSFYLPGSGKGESYDSIAEDYKKAGEPLGPIDEEGEAFWEEWAYCGYECTVDYILTEEGKPMAVAFNGVPLEKPVSF